MNNATKYTCHLCGCHRLADGLNSGIQPIAQQLLLTKDATPFRHPHHVGRCKQCGLVQLLDTAPPEYFYSEYFTLSSWKKQPHIDQLLDLASDGGKLSRACSILEVGSNDGTFLRLMRERGYTNVVGNEPADDAYRAAVSAGIETLHAYLSPETAETFVAKYGQQDVLVCRHVIEHISDLRMFARALRRILKPGARVVLELPDGSAVLDWLDYSGLWDQHCNYLTPRLMRHFADLCGVTVTQHFSVSFSGVAQVLVGTFDDHSTDVVPSVDIQEERRMDLFVSSAHEFKRRFREFLLSYRRASRKIVAIGAGNRTITFLNLLGLGDCVDCVMDDQPEKQNKYLPGSLLPVFPSGGVCGPEFYNALFLLGVNFESEEQVIAKHPILQRADVDVYSIHPPSVRLAPPWREIKPELPLVFEGKNLL